MTPFRDEQDLMDVLRAAGIVVLLIVGAFALAFGLSACHSAPIIVQPDTVAQQKAAEKAAKDLEKVRTNPQNTIVPQDQAVIITAENQIHACADTLKARDGHVQKLGAALGDCQKALAHSEESGGSFLTRTKRAFLEYWHVLTSSVVAFTVGTFFGRTIFAMLWAAAKAALHIA